MNLISSATICTWHRLAFQQFVPPSHPYYAGNMRQHSVAMPCLFFKNGVVGTTTDGRRILLMAAAEPHEAIPAVERLILEMNAKISELKQAWANFTEEQRVLLLCSTCARFMGAFNRIHPFINGNGRMTRLLMKWMLAHFGYTTTLPAWTRPAPVPEYNLAIARASSHGVTRSLANFIAKTVR